MDRINSMIVGSFCVFIRNRERAAPTFAFEGYQAARPSLFSDAVARITGLRSGLSNARPVNSHPPVLTTESTRRNHQTKTDVVVTIIGCIVVTVGRTTVVTIVDPRTATNHQEWLWSFGHFQLRRSDLSVVTMRYGF